jgi:peptide/nickel transport system substrate-binding protein
VGSAIPQYPYDPTRAQQLLAQAGWTRGSDGILRDPATGDRFEVEVRARSQEFEKAATVVASDWKVAGTVTSLHTIPAALLDDRSQEATAPGGLVATAIAPSFMEDRLDSRTTMGPANHWVGKNQGGYYNPQADAVYDRLRATIAERDRIPLQRELVQLIMGDVAIMPLHWNVEPVLALNGVKAEAIGYTDAWNLFEWDINK